MRWMKDDWNLILIVEFLAFVIIAISVLSMIAGCVYRGAKVTEGVDFSAGLSIPATEGAVQVSFVNYLSGFRFGVAENSGMDCEYFGTNTFSFAWGLWESAQFKHFKAKVEPCEVAPPAQDAKDEPDDQKADRK